MKFIFLTVCEISFILKFSKFIQIRKFWYIYSHSVCCICLRSCRFWLETRVIITISTLSLLLKKLWLIFMGMKQKQNKKSKWPTQKNCDFQNLQIVIELNSRIDWCEGHWCGSTCIVVRLSNISSKTGKKWCIFFCF